MDNQYKYHFGKNSTALFHMDDNGLTLSVLSDNQNYQFEFKDEIFLNKHFYDKSAYTGEMFSVPIYGEKAVVTEEDQKLRITSKITPELTAFNLFTMSNNSATILLETYFESTEKIYDCSYFVARTKLNLDGLTQIGGANIPEFFPITTTPPYYGFNGHLILKGEKKFLKITGGNVSMVGDVVDAHTHTNFYNDDLTFYGKNTPLKTAYTFENTPLPPCFENKEEPKMLVPEHSIISGNFKIDYHIKKDGAVFVHNGKEYPMVSMLFKNIETGNTVFCDTTSDWTAVTAEDHEFRFEHPYGIKELGLILSYEKKENQNRIEWTVEVKNDSKLYTLMWCSYPRMYFSSHEKCDLFRPCHGGAIFENVNQTDYIDFGAYPSGFQNPMPFYAVYSTESEKKGNYFAIHDPDGAFKEFYVASDSFGTLRFLCRFIAENYTQAGNGQILPGKAVWQQFNGDWYDAANIYKEFVQTCDWYPKAKENGRENIPEWMRDIPFWIMDWMPNESEDEEPIPISLRPNIENDNENAWFETPIKLREELGVPIGFHLYNWHAIPFNNDYPHFLPAKKALDKGLEKLKEADIKIMPYINALLWDNKDKRGEDYRFTKDALPGAVKNQLGIQHKLTYAAHEPDGELVEFSPMCPSAKVWRNELKALISKMFTEYDFDAVYLDQIATRVPHFCMDKNHGHPLGGGSWWQKNYRELLDEINAIKPEGKGFTSESNAEVYANNLDGFLSWKWVSVKKDVPAFMQIYGGKITVLGRSTNGYMKDNTTYWKYHLAQSLISGEQLGWINSDFVFNQTKLSFAKTLVQYRYENKEFFRGAAPLRPPVVEASEEHKFCTGIGMSWLGVLHEPYLCVGILENGTTKKLLIVNIAETEISDTISFRPDENGLKKDKVAQFGKGDITFIADDKIKATLPSGGLVVLTWETE